MDYKALLVFAAKSCGLTHLTEWSDRISDYDSPHYGRPALHASGVGGQCDSWNPLEDDRDAFRLAVRLQLTVANEHLSSGVAYCVRYGDRPEEFPEVRSESFNSPELTEEDYAATRRAIVLAAAKIGGYEDD